MINALTLFKASISVMQKPVNLVILNENQLTSLNMMGK